MTNVSAIQALQAALTASDSVSQRKEPWRHGRIRPLSEYYGRGKIY